MYLSYRSVSASTRSKQPASLLASTQAQNFLASANFTQTPKLWSTCNVFEKKSKWRLTLEKTEPEDPSARNSILSKKNPKISIVAAMWWNQRLLKNVTPKSFKKGQNVSTDRMGLCGAHLFERFFGFESESVKSVKIHDFKCENALGESSKTNSNVENYREDSTLRFFKRRKIERWNAFWKIMKNFS